MYVYIYSKCFLKILFHKRDLKKILIWIIILIKQRKSLFLIDGRIIILTYSNSDSNYAISKNNAQSNYSKSTKTY